MSLSKCPNINVSLKMSHSKCPKNVSKNVSKMFQFVFPSVIKRMLNDLDEDQKRKKKFKNVQKLVAAYNVGTSTKNVTLCQWLFPCQEKMAEEEEVEGVQTRVKCTQMSKLCPGFSISCAMCGMLMPQACAGVCPFAGLYCGKLYSCLSFMHVQTSHHRRLKLTYSQFQVFLGMLVN